MEFYKQTLKGLQDLNTALRSEGDAARVRYVSFEPDYDYADSWIVLVTWEVPEPAGDQWPPDMLDLYRERTRDRVGESGTAHCLFRTPDEVREPVHQRGAMLQPA